MRKWLLFPTALIMVLSQPVFALLNYSNGDHAIAVSTIGRTVSALFGISFMMITKRLPLWVCEGVIMSFGYLFCFVADFFDFGLKDQWVAIIVITDLLLLTGCRSTTITINAIVVALYLLFKSGEEGIGFGVYDSIPEGWSTEEPLNSRGVGWFSFVTSIRLGAFALDFFLTRKFAMDTRAEKANAQASADMAKEVAAALVRFDLETATRLVGEGEDDLRAAFRGLLGNLRMYRPYLPDALFTDDDGFRSLDSTEMVPKVTETQRPIHFRNRPPGLETETVTMVFTDIQSSTDIWEKCTSAMREAMECHNNIMRECIQLVNGYEVKTIGDAFMVAFDSTFEGMKFCLTAQEKLYAATWPVGIMSHPLCKENSTHGWKGLRVRMGLHTGQSKLEVNPTTGRTDYMGPTINKAARIESASAGGGVAVADDVAATLTSLQWNDLGSPTRNNIGKTELKGVGEVPLQIVLPQSLQKRRSEVLRTIRARKDGTRQRRESSDGNGSVRSQSIAPNRGMMKNKLTVNTATVATVCINFDLLRSCASVVDLATEITSAVIESVERTEGQISSICSGAIVAVWNAGRQCPAHVAQSAKFVSHTYRAISGTCWAENTTVGLASDRILHGSLGTSKQRFFTVIGSPVEKSRTLANGAASLNTFCLLTGSSCAATDTTMQKHTRPVEIWSDQSTTWGSSNDVIYEFNLVTFSQVSGVWNFYDGDIETEWGKMYKEAFDDRDYNILDKMGETDPVVKSVVAAMRNNKPLLSTHITSMRGVPFSRLVGDLVEREMT
eukprot:TRINITY_DN3928_c3_g1_i1.p1 TRINITY_DN3928_c3_g1~~TRINITY_DN3928_c3_g1_i1.p1  ORF type:complete len:859 (+),score=170.82 TRINITY_DN3928_c3_g1_i1:234-2579(+)